MTKDTEALQRPYPKLFDQSEAKALLVRAENLWSDLQANNLGGFSGINRPFYILHEFRKVIEEFGNRDVGLAWSKDQLDAALSTPASDELGFDPTMEVGDEVFPHDAPASDVAPVAEGYPGLQMSDAELSKHYEASKMDAVSLVGSEVRQIIGELRYHRAHPPLAQSVDPVAGEALLLVHRAARELIEAYDDPDGPTFVKLNALRAALAALKGPAA